MKLIKEFKIQVRVARSFDKVHDIAIAYVTEYKTIYKVTIKIMGYALPSVFDWRVSKKDVKSAKEAIFYIANKALLNGNL